MQMKRHTGCLAWFPKNKDTAFTVTIPGECLGASPLSLSKSFGNTMSISGLRKTAHHQDTACGGERRKPADKEGREEQEAGCLGNVLF